MTVDQYGNRPRHKAEAQDLSETPAAECVDAVVSLVLYKTPIEEVEQVVRQVMQSRLNLRVHLIDNSPEPTDLSGFTDPRIVHVHNARNLGYGSGHNIAIRDTRARGRYHVVLNTDLVFDGTVIDRLVAFMDARPTAGLTMPKIVYPDGTIQHLCRLLPTPLDIFGRRVVGRTAFAKRRNRRYEFCDWTHDQIAEFPFLSGCFMVIRRSVLDALGGFDQRFFMYFEDIDLSRRINEISETLFVPLGPVMHEYRTQSRTSWRLRFYALASTTRYFCKWGWMFDRGRVSANRKAIDQFGLAAALR